MTYATGVDQVRSGPLWCQDARGATQYGRPGALCTNLTSYYRCTDTQLHRHTDTRTHRRTDAQTHGHTYTYTYTYSAPHRFDEKVGL
eukprot:5859992-Amphidinium_carterae.1